MNAQHQKLLDTILDVVRTHYADDIAVILLYGSTVNGTAHDKSDLDLLIVPKTDKGWNFGKTFILDGVGYDLWVAPWSTLESIMRKEDMRTAILADSVLLYCADEADRGHYELLKKNSAAVHPLNVHDYRPAMNFVTRAKQYYGELCLSDSPSAIGGIIMELVNALSILNRTYLRFGTKKILEEAAQFDLLPPDFIENARCAMLYPESARKVCGDLIRSAENFIRAQFAQYLCFGKLGGCVTGLYEEVSSHWNKIRYACAHDDAVTAFLAAASLQNELAFASDYLGLTEKFDLFEGYDSAGLPAFSAHCDAVEDAFVSALREAGVPITVYESADELREYLIAARDETD